MEIIMQLRKVKQCFGKLSLSILYRTWNGMYLTFPCFTIWEIWYDVPNFCESLVLAYTRRRYCGNAVLQWTTNHLQRVLVKYLTNFVCKAPSPSGFQVKRIWPGLCYKAIMLYMDPSLNFAAECIVIGSSTFDMEILNWIFQNSFCEKVKFNYYMQLSLNVLHKTESTSVVM